MYSIHHSNHYSEMSLLIQDVEKLKAYGYQQINETDELKDFQFQIKGPQGLNISRAKRGSNLYS